MRILKKKLLSIISCFIIFIFCGCNTGYDEKNNDLIGPSNNSIEIEGVWEVNNYTILDNKIAKDKKIQDLIDSSIIIENSQISIGNSTYDNINYKLKKVNQDYVITYEVETSLQDLGINDNNIKVYSINHDNNLIGEIIYINKDKTFLYYQGYLLDLKYNGDLSEDNLEVDNNKINTSVSEDINTSEGILIGLKSKDSVDSNGGYIRGKYRTLWISTINGDIQTVGERKDIILPRNQGMWTVIPKVYKNDDENIYYEYFQAEPIESVNTINEFDFNGLSSNKILKRNIKYISGDYIGTEVINNERFSESPVYEFLPLDNILTNSPIQIADIYGSMINSEYQRAYEDAYSSVSVNDRSKLNKYINYSNFTVVRNNGRWCLQGRISPIVGTLNSVDFSINEDVNSKLSKYNILTIPWKVLKGKIPLFLDAYTSPSGNLAIIIVKGEILVYTISNGQLSNTPIDRITINNDEEVIMSEWCENEYVKKWGSYF